jgi:aryl-phospho-beta-D-glucosidase BglC (GH1 family)
MKTTTTILALILSLGLYAQDQKLAIGKTSVDGDALVDFGDELRGMVLAPIQDATSSGASAGTIAFDGNTGSFRYYDGTAWSAVIPGGETGGHATGTDTFKQLIGTTSSSANAVVVLGENTGEDQAMVLPKLENGNLKFNNPVAGLMYYDTALKAVLVYNGNAWTRF